MGMIKLESCCGCATLQTGSKIIGYLQAIFSAIGAIVFILAAIGIKHAKDLTEEEKTAVLVTSIIFAVVFIIQIIFAVLLILGATKLRAGYLTPWLVFTIICIVLNAINNIINLTAGHFTGQQLAMFIVQLALSIYFYLVVYNLREDIKSGRTQ